MSSNSDRAGARVTASVAGEALPEIEARIAAGLRIHRRVPGLGFLHIERPLPFLGLCQREALPAGRTEKLVSTLPAYFVIDEAVKKSELASALKRLGASLAASSGAALLLEIRATAVADSHLPFDSDEPRFRISSDAGSDLDETLSELQAALLEIRIDERAASVTTVRSGGANASVPQLAGQSVFTIVLEVEPIYRSRDGVFPFPMVMRVLRQQLDVALRRAFFVFARRFAKNCPSEPRAFARRKLVKAARDVDRRLANVSNSLRYLFLVTPTNTEQAFHEFCKNGCGKPPKFAYRPLDVDPEISKREIYETQLERVEDPTLIAMFQEKQQELDRLITLLVDRQTERFRWGSMQLFGGVDEHLLALARRVLEQTSGAREEPGQPISAETFADLARREVEWYRSSWPELVPQVVVRADVPGLMVVNGSLVIGKNVSLTLERAQALIQHEIGTHLVTFYNGSAQPLHHLGSGLAGYEALQEGLGVLAEYLVGGLSSARLRLIAARVIAVHSLVNGAEFVETYRLLVDRVGLGSRAAFTAAMRVHRSGGLTKDAIYLRGLEQVLDYLGNGGDTDDLLVGKVGIQHLPLVRELRLRGVIRPPRLRPRWLSDPVAQERLASLRKGATVLDLLKGN